MIIVVKKRKRAYKMIVNIDKINKIKKMENITNKVRNEVLHDFII